MTQFDAIATSVLASCYSVFGEPAAYDGDLVTVVMTTDMTQWGDQVSVATGRVALSVRKSEVPVRPSRGAQFSVGDAPDIYRVEQTIRETEYEWTLLVKGAGE